jgi:hypothetical protein
MIQASASLKGKTKVKDDSEFLTKEEQACVQAGITSGLESFTVPTLDDDQKVTRWKVEPFIFLRDKAPVVCKVAYRLDNPDFRVMGPEAPSTAPSNGLQKR